MAAPRQWKPAAAAAVVGVAVGLLVGAAAAAAAAPVAAAATAARTIPFPSPPPGSPSAGRFHTLGALQCRLHLPPTGGASPDAHAVASSARRGDTGWTLRANRSTPPVFVPYAPGTCASPLDDAEQLAFLASPAETACSKTADWWRRAPSTAVASGGDPAAEFEWAGNWLYTLAAGAASKGAPVGGMISAEWFRPHHCATAPGRSGLVCEEEVARLLTLQRNQRFGAVTRHTSVYDVMSVTRGTIGIALNRRQQRLVIAAVDTLSNGSYSTRSFTSVLMYTPRVGPRRPVLVGESALLSLGRGVMADSSWLGGSFPSGLNANVRLRRIVRGTSDPPSEVSWPLGKGSDNTNSSLWLQRLATLFCQPPAGSFVSDSGLCSGVELREPSARTELLAGGQPVGSELGLDEGGFLRVPRETVRWSFKRAAKMPRSTPCPSFDDLDWLMPLRQPIWLLGRKSREIHGAGPGSEVEVDLAARLSSCSFDKYKRPKAKTFWLSRVEALVAALSDSYRRADFHVDAPADPVSNSELLLAVLVVVPEAATIVLLLIQRRRQPPRRPPRWSWREGLMLGLAVVAGAAALIAVGFVDWQERRGAAWRAATTRLELSLPASDKELLRGFDATGRYVTLVESLLLVARTGYRPHLTRRLAVGMTAAYAGLVLAVLARVATAAVWPPRPSHDHEADGPANDAGGVLWGDLADGNPLLPGWRQRWRRRRLRWPRIPAPRGRRGTRESAAAAAAAAAANADAAGMSSGKGPAAPDAWRVEKAADHGPWLDPPPP